MTKAQDWSDKWDEGDPVATRNIKTIQRDAVRELIGAIGALGARCGNLTYFEASPTRNTECSKRWTRLNNAIVEAKSI